MTAYITSPTLSSPSQYAPTHHGHGHGYGYSHSHVRGQASISLSSAPLRSALARRAQASECVQLPKRDSDTSPRRDTFNNAAMSPVPSGPARTRSGAYDSPASLRTYELLSDSSCSTWQPAVAADTYTHTHQSSGNAFESNATTYSRTSPTPQTASAQYANQIRSGSAAITSVSSSAATGAGLDLRLNLGSGLNLDLDKQYEYGRLLRKASQSFRSGGATDPASPRQVGIGGVSSTAGSGVGVGVSRAKTVLDSPYRETRPASRSSAGRDVGHSQQPYGGHKRYTLSVSTSPGQTETPQSQHHTLNHERNHSRASIGSTPRQRPPVGSLHIQHQVRSVMMPSDGYGMSYAADDMGARHRQNGANADAPPATAASTTRPSANGAPDTVYSPAANARRVSQYGLSAPSWRNANLDVQVEGSLEPKDRTEDRNRPSSYLRSGPRLTKYADFDFDALDSDTAHGAGGGSGVADDGGANTSLSAPTHAKQAKSGTGKSILGAWTANIGNSVGRRGKEERESFLDLGMGEKARHGGAAANTGSGKMMKFPAGAASKWISSVGTNNVDGTVKHTSDHAQDGEQDVHSFFDGYSSRSKTRTAKSGSSTKAKSPKQADPTLSHAQVREKVNSMAPSTYSGISTHLSLSNTTNLSPSPSTDSRWSIGTTRRAHAELLLPSLAVRSDSKTLLQGFGLGLDRLGVGERGVGGGGAGAAPSLSVSAGNGQDVGMGRTERTISVGTVLEADIGGLGLYAINGAAMGESGSETSLDTSASAGRRVLGDLRGEPDQASLTSDAGTGSRSGLSDQVITPDLSVSYSGPSEYVSTRPPIGQATPSGPLHANDTEVDVGNVERDGLPAPTQDKQPFASGSPGFGLISLEAAQERERQRSRSGQTTNFASTGDKDAQSFGQSHTPRASTSTARTTATSVHTNGGGGKMPVPRSSTSTIAQKIKSKKSLIALIKSATTSAAATFGSSASTSGQHGTGSGNVSGLRGAASAATSGAPPLPNLNARRPDAVSIKGLIGDPIPLIQVPDEGRATADGALRASQDAVVKRAREAMDEYGEGVEEVDDFRADQVGSEGYSTGLLSPLPHTTPSQLGSVGSVQPKLELRPVSMNFAHVMPEGYLVMDYSDIEPMPTTGDSSGGAGAQAVSGYNYDDDRPTTTGREQDVSSVHTAPSSSSFSTSSSAYPAVDLSLPRSGSSTSRPAHNNDDIGEHRKAQRELINLRKLHAMQISELSSQLREARDELASLRAEHLDVLEELADTAAIAASAVTKQHARGAEKGWRPKEGGCAICGCVCAMHGKHGEGQQKEEEAMVVSENLTGSPSTRRLAGASHGRTGASDEKQTRTRTHRSQKSYGQSATPGRARSGTLRHQTSDNVRADHRPAATATTTIRDVLGERDRNAVYPALAAPPSASSGPGPGGLRSPVVPAISGQQQSGGQAGQGEVYEYKKTGVMDRARVKTGGARGFGTGSLYQWE